MSQVLVYAQLEHDIKNVTFDKPVPFDFALQIWRRTDDYQDSFGWRLILSKSLWGRFLDFVKLQVF